MALILSGEAVVNTFIWFFVGQFGISALGEVGQRILIVQEPFSSISSHGQMLQLLNVSITSIPIVLDQTLAMHAVALAIVRR